MTQRRETAEAPRMEKSLGDGVACLIPNAVVERLGCGRIGDGERGDGLGLLSMLSFKPRRGVPLITDYLLVTT